MLPGQPTLFGELQVSEKENRMVDIRGMTTEVDFQSPHTYVHVPTHKRTYMLPPSRPWLAGAT